MQRCWPPSDVLSASRRSRRRAVSESRAPRAASLSANALPIPALAPVMMMTISRTSRFMRHRFFKEHGPVAAAEDRLRNVAEALVISAQKGAARPAIQPAKPPAAHGNQALSPAQHALPQAGPARIAVDTEHADVPRRFIAAPICPILLIAPLEGERPDRLGAAMREIDFRSVTTRNAGLHAADAFLREVIAPLLEPQFLHMPGGIMHDAQHRLEIRHGRAAHHSLAIEAPVDLHVPAGYAGAHFHRLRRGFIT